MSAQSDLERFGPGTRELGWGPERGLPAAQSRASRASWITCMAWA
jgi:hypothetical protein